MKLSELYEKALDREFLSGEEGVFLFENAPASELMLIADELRKKQVPDNRVGWIIDRNVNTTNVCIANCKFCNFFRPPGHEESYITSIDAYVDKIEEMKKYGGDQLLIQGGHHPELGLSFYTDLFKELKKRYPEIKLHALGPPEVDHISKLEKLGYEAVLSSLMEAGMDSLPGAGAEIFNERVRRLVSRGKCSGNEWLNVMRAAHKLNLPASATMMFGHEETIPERMEHLVLIRDIQAEKPEGHYGFISFIPWPYQDEGTLLQKVRKRYNEVTADEYIRMIAISRIMLPNIQHIQTSWLTVGKNAGQLTLHAGADDFGSIMIEENVVSAAGAPHRFTSEGIQRAISEAGFQPRLRNQKYEDRPIPKIIEQQIINY